MKKGRIRNALLGAVGIALAAIMLISVNPTSASAYDGGAGAGSGGGGGGNGSWGAISRWNYVSTWDQLVNSQYMLSNMNSSGAGARNAGEAAEWFVRTSSGGQGLLDMCKGPNLVRIYYLGASGGIPIKPNSSTGTFTWTNPAGGDAVDQYAGGLNGRGVYVICVINPIETKTWTQPDSRDRNDGAGRTFTADTAWMTNVAPEADLLKDGVDVIGQPNLHDQGITTVETAFGALKRTIGTSGGSGNYDARATQIQQAIDSDASRAHASVNLDAENRAGMAEGGVLTVTEQTKRGSIILTQSWKEHRSRQVTCDYRPGSSDPIPNTCTYGDWTAWSETPGTRSFQSTSPAETSAVNTGFFQLLSVHCNPNEFNALTSRLTALGGPNAYELVSQTTGVDGTTTSVIKTAHFNNRGEAINSRRILGANLSSLAAEVRRTGQLGFYDKECNAQCVSNPSASSGASSANGALSNVSITSNNNANPGTHGGANLVKNGATNSNYFEIFRDNDTNRITINTAYPRNNDPQLKYGGTFRNAANTANVNIPASAPVSTTVTRWAEGTPGTNKGDAGGVFQMTAIGSTNQLLFQSATGTVGVQKNFGTDTYSSPNSQVLNGFYRTFDVQSTWASEKDKPQVINVKWEYRPTVYTRFPGTVGFTANNNSAQIVANGEVVVDQAVDVKCYAQYGSYDRNLDLSNRVQSSTGTGSTNTLDSAPLESPSGDNSWVTQSNLVIKFVRGVAE